MHMRRPYIFYIHLTYCAGALSILMIVGGVVEESLTGLLKLLVDADGKVLMFEKILTKCRESYFFFRFNNQSASWNGRAPPFCKMVHFTGTIKLMVSEAEDLRPTDFATRHQVVGLITKGPQLIDPYIAIDIDDTPVGRTTTKPKTSKPVWNEEFSSEVHNGQNIGLTVFHDAAIPPDEFVANCTIAFEDIAEKKTSDIWVWSS